MTKTLDNLHQFTGTAQWFRHPLNRAVLYTEGAQYVAEQVGAYWLLDEIALAQQYTPAAASEPFQVWELKVTGSKATLVCEDGNGRTVHTKEIDFTDFPEPGIRFFCTDNVILLPSEY